MRHYTHCSTNQQRLPVPGLGPDFRPAGVPGRVTQAEVEQPFQQQGGDESADEAANGPLPGLVGADAGGHGVTADGSANQVGPGVGGEGGQQGEYEPVAAENVAVVGEGEEVKGGGVGIEQVLAHLGQQHNVGQQEADVNGARRSR